MSLPPSIAAIRTRVALHRSDDTRVLSLRGDDARDALLHLLPSHLYLRDAQVRPSFLLREDGTPVADVLVCADDEDYFLLVEGLTDEELLSHVEGHLPDGLAPTIEVRSEDLAVVSLTGPWSWELAVEVLGSDMIALPYLNFFRIDHGHIVRAGKTGEFGYDIVVERAAAEELARALLQKGEAWEVAEVDDEALSICRFENWFFDPAHVPEGVTPIELQLQWRLDMSRPWVGRAAIDARREAGVARRLCCVSSERELAPGDAISLRGEVVGEVTRAARSPLLDATIGAALIDVAWAWGGIDGFEVQTAAGAVPAKTLAPPLVDNQSIYVDPRRHSFRERDEIELGPLVRHEKAPRAES